MEASSRLLRAALRVALWCMRTARAARQAALGVYSKYLALDAAARDHHKGFAPSHLRSVALVFGDESSAGGGEGERGLAWEKVVPALACAARYFEERDASSVLIHDLNGVLKSQWGERELRKGLWPRGTASERKGNGAAENGNGSPSEATRGCDFKLLSRDDWDDCVCRVTREWIRGKRKGGSLVLDSQRLSEWVEAHPVRSLGGHGGSDSSESAIGPPPDLILCFSSQGKAFTLADFFPWHAKSAEIYHVCLDLSAGPDLVARLDRIAESYFGTKQRFGT